MPDPEAFAKAQLQKLEESYQRAIVAWQKSLDDNEPNPRYLEVAFGCIQHSTEVMAIFTAAKES